MNETVDFIKEEFNKVYPSGTFDSFFLDEHFNQQYESDTRFGKIFRTFTIIAILIAALGLFGLTSFVVLQKRKEISVRRVLGAKLNSIIRLISKEFFIQLGIAIGLWVPLVIYALNSWLMRFPKKMVIGLDLFLVPILSLLTIVLLVVIYQSVKAISANPTDSLRD